MVAVEVNGKPAHFLIDTGGPDIIIDPDFAKEVGATVVDDGVGVFAGGLRATVRRTVVDSFALGGLAVSKQAAGVLPTRGLPFGGKTSIDGVIGTGFLMHFLATIDYGHHALILAPRENVVVRPGATSVPMWFGGIYTPEGSPLSAFPFAVGGVVSHGFFSPGALTFDFANMRLIVTK